MGVTKANVGRNIVWANSDNPHRPYDAIGPQCNKILEDFIRLPMTAAAIPEAYTTTLVNASTIALVASGAALGGRMVITTDAAENDGAQMQALGEAFLPTANNKIYFGCKFQVSAATQSDFLVGLTITDTTALGGVTDGIYFRKIDETTACNFVIETASTETATAALTIVAATDYTLEFYWDGAALYFYVDGVLGGTPVLTNIPTAEYMTPTIAFLTGAAAVITMTVDWMRTIQITQ